MNVCHVTGIENANCIVNTCRLVAIFVHVIFDFARTMYVIHNSFGDRYTIMFHIIVIMV